MRTAIIILMNHLFSISIGVAHLVVRKEFASLALSACHIIHPCHISSLEVLECMLHIVITCTACDRHQRLLLLKAFIQCVEVSVLSTKFVILQSSMVLLCLMTKLVLEVQEFQELQNILILNHMLC